MDDLLIVMDTDKIKKPVLTEIMLNIRNKYGDYLIVNTVKRINSVYTLGYNRRTEDGTT